MTPVHRAGRQDPCVEFLNIGDQRCAGFEEQGRRAGIPRDGTGQDAPDTRAIVGEGRGWHTEALAQRFGHSRKIAPADVDDLWRCLGKQAVHQCHHGLGPASETV